MSCPEPEQVQSPDLDFQLIGSNIANIRRIQGLSQAELAAIAKISRTTLQRIECGMPTFLSTLEKIAHALGDCVEDLCIAKRFQHPLTDETAFVKHSIGDDYWYPIEDQRRKKPKNDQELIQTEEERRRLGKLGFVRAFVSGMNFFLPLGPGINKLELYGKISNLTMPQFQVFAVYGLEGAAIATVASIPQKLKRGEVMAVHSKHAIELEPDFSEDGHAACKVLLFGSSRKKVNLNSRINYG